MTLVIEVTTSATTSLTPDQVIAAAADFSDAREKLWSNCKNKYLQVHDRGADFAEVTEGFRLVTVFWERSRYDWSQPGVVKATVMESNVFKPGSTWELRATRRNGGSKVEMTLNRDFQSGFRGSIASAVNHGFGDRWRRLGWARMLRQVLREIEKQSG